MVQVYREVTNLGMRGSSKRTETQNPAKILKRPKDLAIIPYLRAFFSLVQMQGTGILDQSHCMRGSIANDDPEGCSSRKRHPMEHDRMINKATRAANMFPWATNS